MHVQLSSYSGCRFELHYLFFHILESHLSSLSILEFVIRKLKGLANCCCNFLRLQRQSYVRGSPLDLCEAYLCIESLINIANDWLIFLFGLDDVCKDVVIASIFSTVRDLVQGMLSKNHLYTRK